MKFFSPYSVRFIVKWPSLLVPSQAPEYVALFNTSSITLRAVWAQVPDCCRHGIIRGYRLFLRDNNTEEFVRNETTEAGQYEFEFSPLLKFYGYSVSVLAFTIKGDGPLIEASAMTEEDGKNAFWSEQTNKDARSPKVTKMFEPYHINNRRFFTIS